VEGENNEAIVPAGISDDEVEAQRLQTLLDEWRTFAPIAHQQPLTKQQLDAASCLLGTFNLRSNLAQAQHLKVDKRSLQDTKMKFVEDLISLSIIGLKDVLDRYLVKIRAGEIRMVGQPEFKRFDDTPRQCELEADTSRNIAHFLQMHFAVRLVAYLENAQAHTHLRIQLPTWLAVTAASSAAATYDALQLVVSQYEKCLDEFYKKVVEIQGEPYYKDVHNSMDSAPTNTLSTEYEQEKRSDATMQAFNCETHMSHKGFCESMVLIPDITGKMCRASNALSLHGTLAKYRAQTLEHLQGRAYQMNEPLPPDAQLYRQGCLRMMFGDTPGELEEKKINQQRKCDILVPNWKDGKVALFDVGLTHTASGGVRGGEEGAEPARATRRARSKSKDFDDKVISQLRGGGVNACVNADALWQFIPLCGDTAGAWAKQARDTIHHCAAQIDLDIRGHVVGLWHQMLSIAVQREHDRVLQWKASACLGTPPPAFVAVDLDIGAMALLPSGLS